MLGCSGEAVRLLGSHGSSADLGGWGEAVEVVAFGVEALGEVPGVPLLFESVVNDGSAGGLPMLETARRPARGRLGGGRSLGRAG